MLVSYCHLLPNHDRFGSSRQMVLGYEGTTRLVDGIANFIVEMNERGG